MITCEYRIREEKSHTIRPVAVVGDLFLVAVCCVSGVIALPPTRQAEREKEDGAGSRRKKEEEEGRGKFEHERKREKQPFQRR